MEGLCWASTALLELTVTNSLHRRRWGLPADAADRQVRVFAHHGERPSGGVACAVDTSCSSRNEHFGRQQRRRFLRM